MNYFYGGISCAFLFTFINAYLNNSLPPAIMCDLAKIQLVLLYRTSLSILREEIRYKDGQKVYSWEKSLL